MKLWTSFSPHVLTNLQELTAQSFFQALHTLSSKLMTTWTLFTWGQLCLSKLFTGTVLSLFQTSAAAAAVKRKQACNAKHFYLNFHPHISSKTQKYETQLSSFMSTSTWLYFLSWFGLWTLHINLFLSVNINLAIFPIMIWFVNTAHFHLFLYVNINMAI